MKQFSFSSLRVRLILLVLLAVVPIILLLFYNNLEQRQLGVKEIEAQSLQMTRLAAGNMEQIIEGARQLSIGIAEVIRNHMNEHDYCNSYLKNIADRFPQYTNIGVADPSGNIIFAPVLISKAADPINVADRMWFKRAIETKQFSVGEFLISRPTGRKSLVFSYPEVNESGEIKAVVGILFNLDWLNNQLGDVYRLEERSLLMIDSCGVIIACQPEPEKWVGKAMPDAGVIKAILAQDEGTTEVTSLDGIKRLYSFIPVKGTSKSMYVSVGIPKEVVFAKINKILTNNLIWLGIVAMLALISAWLGGDIFMLRQVKVLTDATQRLSSGDLSARIKPPYKKGELGQLAHAFDQMAESLGQREAERKQTEDALRRSEDASSRLAGENKIMAEIGRIVSSTLNIEEVHERFAEEVRKLIPFDRIVVALNNFELNTITVAYISGEAVLSSQVGHTFPINGSINEETVRTRSSVIIQTEDIVALGDRFPPLRPNLQVGLLSTMAIPLISKDQVIGALHFRSFKSNAYTEMDLRLAERVGNQIAGAIANAQLFAERKRAEEAMRRSEEEAKRLAQENAIVAEIGQIISSTLDITEVYEHFAEEVRKLIPFDRIAINIINPGNDTVTVAYATGIEVKGRQIGDIFPIAGTQTEKAIRTRSAQFLQVANKEELAEQFPGLLPFFQTGARSLISIPLISKDQVIGVVNFRSNKPNIYSERDLRLAERVGNQIAGAIANAQLYAEVKRTDGALRKSEAKFQGLFDKAPVGYMELDTEGRIAQVNRTELAMLGYTAEEMLGQPVWKFIVEEEMARQIVMAKLSGSIQPGKAFERTYRRKDGTTLPVLVGDAFLRDAEARVTGIHSIVQDITERKRAEEEMAQLQEQLRQSQKMEAIGRLAGGIAHDFNNLLTVIKGYGQLSLLELKEGNPLRGNIEEIQKATERAANLTRQLLAYSRRQILDFKVLNLNVLLQDLNKMLHRILGEDIELIYGLADDLGKVKTDLGQFEQVILNLAVNARDAMPNGGKLIIDTANVELDEAYALAHIAVKPGLYVMLSVSDNGVGMTPEVKELIFEPFFTTKEKGRGTGLGLSTVYGIVKQSGGNIWVYSEPGQGTTFKIYLPRADELPGEMGKKEIVEKIPLGSETILLVEDEEAVRKLAVKILKNQGYKVLEASNGIEASAIFEKRKEPIHLILTDVVMPEMSGRQFVEQFRQVCQDFKVLYMSGYTDNTIVHHGVLERGINYIQKPFTPDALARKVREVLNR